MMKSQCPWFRSALAILLDASAQGLCAEVVGLPYPDELFDCFAILQLFIENFARQRGQFSVAGEAERNDLVYREVVGASL